MIYETKESENLSFILLHDLIRSLCLKYTHSTVFPLICTLSFCLNDSLFCTLSKLMTVKKLNNIADMLYKLDEEEKIISSCYSIALTIFYIAAVQNFNPLLVIGLNKIDEKLEGHAWVELQSGEIISSGEESIDKMTILHKWEVVNGLEPWLQKVL